MVVTEEALQKSEEKEIMKRVGFENPTEVEAVITPEQLEEITELIKEIYVDEKLKDYMVDLVFATRKPTEYNIDISDYIQYGASPRATIFLSQAARGFAFLQGRAFVTPQDIKAVAPDVLRHRIILTYEAEAEEITSEQVVQKILDKIEVP